MTHIKVNKSAVVATLKEDNPLNAKWFKETKKWEKEYRKTFLSQGGKRSELMGPLEVRGRVQTMAGLRSPKNLAYWQVRGYSVKQLSVGVKAYNQLYGTDITEDEFVELGGWDTLGERASALNEQLKTQGIKDSGQRALIISQQIYGSE